MKDLATTFASEETGQRIIREFGLVQGTRGVWESHWQEIAERIWTGMSFKFNPYWYSTPGQKKNDFVFDSTAALALDRFGAILDSLLTPRNQTWQSLSASDPKINKRREVKLYFEDVTRILFKYRYSPQANFASQNQMIYKGLGAFGTSAMFVDRLAGSPGLRYRNIPLGEGYIVENHQGVVDKLFRDFKLTARQAFQKWGKEVPDGVRSALERDPEQEFEFIHLVEPRTEYDPERRDFRGRPFAEYYISREETKVLSEDGYNVFPYPVSRYEQYPGEVYGRSPAMNLLPAVKSLNEMKKTMLKQGHRVTDPVLLAHDDGVLDGFSLKPGALNFGGVSANGQALVHALPTGNLSMGKDQMEDERKLINDGFLVSLFQILTENPQMTATEVLERTKEKGILLSPTIGRQQSEYLGPMTERELDLLSQQGLLPPMPAYLKAARAEHKINYESPLARAARADEASGLMRTVQSCIEVAQATQNASILDHFDWDKIVPAMSEIQGVPFHWMKSVDKIAAARQQRAQQAQTNTAIQAAPAAAALMSAGAKVHTATQGGGGGKP